MKTIFNAFGFGALLLTVGTSALAAPISPPPTATRSWQWPLFNIDRVAWQATGAVNPLDARPNVWSSHCEYQEFAQGDLPGTPEEIDLHPGIDIRGQDGDLVLFPESGHLTRVSSREDCGGDRSGADSGVHCRLWVRTDATAVNPALLYYVGHVDVGHRPNSMMNTLLRQQLADAATNGVGDASVDALPLVTKGELAGQVVPFPLTVDAGTPAAKATGWDHLHVGVYDPAQNFDSVDPLAYLNRNFTGAGGVSKVIEDDTRPTVEEVTVRPKGTGGAVDSAGACGPVVSGTLDITANLNDRFLKQNVTLDPFVGDDLPNTTDIKGARFYVRKLDGGTALSAPWFESPIGCSDVNCGLWRVQFADRADYTSEKAFLVSLEKQSHGAPFRAGEAFGNLLWDQGPSANDHTSASPKKKVHILTNRVREDGTHGELGWNTASTGDGRYVVSVEAWDFDGNRNASSTLVRVANQSTSLPAAWIQLRDNDADLGQIPSTMGDQVFWLSNDLQIGEGDAPPLGPRGTPLVVGGTYNVWVNVTNRGCQDKSGVRVAIYSALAGTSFSDFKAITTDGAYDGSFTIPAMSSKLVGPFPWTVTLQDLGGTDQAHRCLLAAVDAPSDPGPVVNPQLWNVPNDPKIAQRNVQFEQLSFFIRNPAGRTQSSVLQLDLDGLPVENPAQAQFDLFLKAPAATWAGLRTAYSAAVPGAVITFEGDLVHIHATKQKITLPAFDMGPVTEIFSTASGSSPADSTAYRVELKQVLDSVQVGGMTFQFLTSKPPG